MPNSIRTTSQINNLKPTHKVIHILFDDVLSILNLNQKSFSCFLVRGTQ